MVSSPFDVHGARFRATDRGGHYESWFVRANHPQRPRAFWIRYTIFSPRGHPENAEGELWAIAFDGENDHHTSVYQSFPPGRWTCQPRRLEVAMGDATLSRTHARGGVRSRDHSIEWDLGLRSEDHPLLLLPPHLYDAGFPQAKSLVAQPMAHFAGQLVVDGTPWVIDDWVGSQNHNWGVRHTSRYAWGQVMGFQGSPTTVLECATVRNRLGPLWTPWLSVVVVRHGDHEVRLNSVARAFWARGRFEVNETEHRWTLHSRNREIDVEAELTASRSSIVELIYRDPPGGTKICRNTKIARCTLRLTPRGERPTELHCPHGAAFEMLESTADSGSFAP